MADPCCNCPCSNVSPEQIDRIEAKLDALIEALAEDDAQEDPAFDLEGQPLGGERDQNQEL